MQWLTGEADKAGQRWNNVDSGRQSSVGEYTEAGVELAEDVTGQTEGDDWTPS